MARVIPREQLAAYQRWQMNHFGEPPEPQARPQAGEDSAQSTVETTQASEVEVIDLPVTLPTAEDIERIHEEARTEGYQAGYAEGLAAAQAEMAADRVAELAKINALTANFASALSHIDQTVADQTLDLALEIARQIVRATLQTRKELLLPLVREALQALPLHHGSINIHVHPDDVNLLREGGSELALPGGMHFVADSGIQPGGCLIKAGHSEIDATVETRWKRVLEAIGVTSKEWMNN